MPSVASSDCNLLTTSCSAAMDSPMVTPKSTRSSTALLSSLSLAATDILTVVMMFSHSSAFPCTLASMARPACSNASPREVLLLLAKRDGPDGQLEFRKIIVINHNLIDRVCQSRRSGDLNALTTSSRPKADSRRIGVYFPLSPIHPCQHQHQHQEAGLAPNSDARYLLYQPCLQWLAKRIDAGTASCKVATSAPHYPPMSTPPKVRPWQ
jgi:hypothetical protein